jgi:DNA-binding NarL/FixJ family response regulator
METKSTHTPNSKKPKKEKTVLTEELKQEMIKLKEQGLSVRKIAEKLSCSGIFVRNSLTKILPKKEPKEEFEKLVAKISELKDQRMRNKEIVAILGISISKLFNVIQKAKTISPKRFAPREKIVAAFNAGKNFKEIANEVGFDKSTIRKALFDLGLRKPKFNRKKINKKT